MNKMLIDSRNGTVNMILSNQSRHWSKDRRLGFWIRISNFI